MRAVAAGKEGHVTLPLNGEHPLILEGDLQRPSPSITGRIVKKEIPLWFLTRTGEVRVPQD